ncbi:SDR family NAD(P)-dependent oxidoreductase [Streptomyces sp. NPDC023838]|uniref:SDR family NAD(P)-dependent oxidoreductase n=1 Tax=Streptomyces sp. NPDC023838 TaxID=3154325 RepID=UPI00340006EE
MSTPEIDRRLARDPVAIVGMSGLFPQAAGLGEFWDNIVSGRDCIDEVPPKWWSPSDHYDPDPFAPDKTYARRGGFLSPTMFDPREFGMPPRTLDSIGLVQLLSLLVARDTLADAGCDDAPWYNPGRTGVVLGVCGGNSTLVPLAARLMVPTSAAILRDLGSSEEVVRRFTRAYLEALPSWTEDSFPGILGNVVSGRIANRMNLGAANHTVDAACASSLAAVRAAVDELLCRRADLMLTGGCDADNSVVAFMCFSQTPALSLSGRVRPFDTAADGTLIGEGIGMLALKRLEDAERDKDRIYAVLRGLGSSSDGRAKSIYAPSAEGQLAALRRAYQDADCSPHTVELIEAHGTGTATGDEVELSALETFLAAPGQSRHVAVGSVKSQIGHTKAAAGAAGLIKAALALHHQVLPPTLNVDHPTGPAGREDSTVYVNTVCRPWVRDPARPVRRAGVSAFGFGGVNYHAVLEEHVPTEGRRERVLHRTPRAYLWHAPEPQDLLERLRRGDVPDEGPVPAGHARLGFVAADEEHYSGLLSAAVRYLDGPQTGQDPPGIHYRRTALPADAKVAALFAGQGSQYVDMGLSALLAIPPVRAAFDKANALSPADDTLARTVFPPPGGDVARADERLRRTDYAQPAVGALAAGQYTFLRELGFAPAGVLGHSFGEVTALWAAGVLDDDSFFRLAQARGRAMRPTADSPDPGAMAAVRLTREAAEHMLADGHPGLAVCNHNAPDEQVIGGPAAQVRRFVRACQDAAVTARLLPVAAAFHTSLVDHALVPFQAACSDAAFRPPRLPVYANTEGAAYGADSEASRGVLVQQLRRPVDFEGRLREMYEDGFRVFVEFGPRQVLTRLVTRTLTARDVETVPCDAGNPASGASDLKEAALRLAVLGMPVHDINRYDAPAAPPRPTPSSVSRLLEGPMFAVESRRDAYERCIEEMASAAPVDRPAPVAEAAPARAADSGDFPAVTADITALTRVATDHLAAHTRFLHQQTDTTKELTDLLRTRTAHGEVDQALVTAVTAITDHGQALSEAHAQAAAAVTDLLRGTGDGTEQRHAHQVPAQWEPTGSPEPQGLAQPQDGTPSAGRSVLAQLLAGENDRPDQALSEVTGLSLEEITETCRAVVAEKTGYDLDMLRPDMYIQEDLGIDSLKQVEIGAELWRLYPSIKREDLFRFTEARTIGELSEMFMETLVASRSSLRHLGEVELRRAFVTLRTAPAVDERAGAYTDQPCALVLDDGGELAALAGSLRARGWRTHHLRLPGVSRDDTSGGSLKDWTDDALEAAFAAMPADCSRLDLCLLPVSRSRCTSAEEAVARLRHSVLTAKYAQAPLAKTAREGPRAAFVTVTQLDGALGLAGAGGDPVAALAGGLGGLVKTAALEMAPVFCRALDYAPELPLHAVAEAFLAELHDVATDVREVAWDGEQRRTPRLSGTSDALLPAPAGTAPLAESDVLLVTGGAQGITAWCVTALAAEHRCGYVLLGRTPLADEPEWSRGLDGPDSLRTALEERTEAEGGESRAPETRAAITHQVQRVISQRAIRATMAELRERGATVEYVSADVRDAESVAAALAPYASTITGVIHGAGVLGDQPLSQMDGESVARVIDTKVSGLHHVLAALDTDRLRHLVVFSSVSGIWGNVRQSDYALANEAVNRYACAYQAAHPQCRVTPLAWGPWEGGMAAPVHQLFEENGVPVLSRDAGRSHFCTEMRRDPEMRGITVIGPATPWLHAETQLPAAGLTATRGLEGLDREPMLRDHRIGGHALLPMTAAVGWALHTAERAGGGLRPVIECRDFTINRGVYFDGHQAQRISVRLTPDPSGQEARVTAHRADGRATTLHFDGVLSFAERDEPAPRMQLPPLDLTSELHPAYVEGPLFHGPSLAGLRAKEQWVDGRLILTACLADPVLAHGAYAGQLFSPGLADLLLQAAGLAWCTSAQDFCGPVSAEKIELFSPLPDDEPFVIVAEAQEVGAMDVYCTATACDSSGRVLQRWSGLRMLRITEEEAVRLLTAASASLEGSRG